MHVMCDCMMGWAKIFSEQSNFVAAVEMYFDKSSKEMF